MSARPDGFRHAALLTDSGAQMEYPPTCTAQPASKNNMFPSGSRMALAALWAAALMFSVNVAQAQSGDAKPAEQKSGGQPGEIGKEGQKVDEFAEAARLVSGPAGNPECVWLGRRVVSLLWRDDMDTAFRHLDLYDRFGCPAPHIQQTFRCLVRQGNNIDQKVPESLNSRVHACWINPTLAGPAAAPATAAPAATPPAASGGEKR
jgi:hypothetical protein